MFRLKLKSSYNGIFKKLNFTFNEGVSVLVGPNGAGKSTLIREIYNYCNGNDIKCFKYDNTKDGGMDGICTKNFGLFSNVLTSSEGEGIIINLGNFIANIGHFISTTTDKYDKIVLLFDAVDSGLSIDNIIEVKRLFDVVIKDKRLKDKEVYIIVSANSYELVEGNDCINVKTSLHRTFKKYDTYRKFIIKEREGGEY